MEITAKRNGQQRFLLILSCTTAASLAMVFIYFQTTIILTRNELALLRSQMRDLLENPTSSSAGVITKESKDSLPNAHRLLAENLPAAVEVIQLIGIIPNVQVKQHGKIGPWRLGSNVSCDWAILKPNKYELEIRNAGLYFLYAQIYYLTTESSNSFEITRTKQKSSEPLSMCANQATIQNEGSPVEVSCYTGIVAKLEEKELIHLNQIEQNRFILSSPGFSHWGVIKLS